MPGVEVKRLPGVGVCRPGGLPYTFVSEPADRWLLFLSFWCFEKILRCSHVFLSPVVIPFSRLEVTTYTFVKWSKILIPRERVRINREMMGTGQGGVGGPPAVT